MNRDASSTCPLGLAAEELSRWRDGDLPADRAEYVESHLAGCTTCQTWLAGYEQIAGGLRAIPEPPLDVPRFWGDLRSQTSNASETRRRTTGTGDTRRKLVGVAAVAAVLLIALGFAQLFASQGTGALSGPSVISTHPATAASTATPTATATPPASAAGIPFSAGCPALGLTSTQPTYMAVGALSVSIPQRVQDYPNALLPNSLPNGPHQVPLTASEAEQAGAFHPDPPVNPTLATGYGFQFCNPTGTSHIVTSLSVTIASFTPSSGPVAVWHVCGDGPYDSVTKQTTPGCGGGIGYVVFLAATLPDDRTGATAPTTADAKFGGPNLPITIGPNESTIVLVAVNGLTSQGTYALTVDIGIDGAVPTSVAPSDGSFLIAPSAVVWTGTACLTAAMQAQIPAATQDTYYVCPPAS